MNNFVYRLYRELVPYGEAVLEGEFETQEAAHDAATDPNFTYIIEYANDQFAFTVEIIGR